MNKGAIFGIVLTVLAVLTVPTVALEEPIFHLIPEDSSCDLGEDVIVWVNASVSHDDINEGQASIIFDPDVVNVTLVEKGTYPNWYMWEYIFGDYGDKKYVSIRVSDVLGAYGPGELEFGKMTLHCEADGISSLHFGNTSELGADRTRIGNASGAIWPIITEDGTFTCGAVETFTKSLLDVGWNLISLPLTATDSNTASVLSGVSYDAVYSYNAATKLFEDVSSGTMNPGIGYFVHVTAPSTWSYLGTSYTSMNIPLEQGLNMVGWHNCTKTIGTESGDALYSIKDNYYYVAKWNATAQEFETYNPVAPNGFNDFSDMARGEGYFISAKAAGTLSESC